MHGEVHFLHIYMTCSEEISMMQTYNSTHRPKAILGPFESYTPAWMEKYCHAGADITAIVTYLNAACCPTLHA